MLKVKKNILLKSLSFFCFFLLLEFGFSQSNTNRYKHFPPEVGGLSANCSKVFQDSRGYIWILQDDGVCSFDGINYKLFDKNDLPSHETRSIAEDANGDIWIGTRSGLAVIRNQNVLNSTALSSFRAEIVNIDTKSQENKIVFRLSDGRISSFELTDSTFKEEDKIELFRTTIDSVDYKVFSDDKFNTSLQITENAKSYLPNTIGNISNIFSYSGKSWVLNDNKLKIILNEKLILQDSLFEANNIREISHVEVINEELYFISKNNLYEFNGLELIKLINGANYSILKSLFKDRENNLWVATDNGVLKFRQSPFFCYNEKNNIKGRLSCFMDDSEGNIWLCSGFGLYKKDERATDFKKILNGKISNFVIDKHDNIIMYDLDKGIRLYDIKLKEEKKFTLISNKIGKSTLEKLNKSMPSIGLDGKPIRSLGMCIDRNENIWIPLENGNLIIQLDTNFKLKSFYGENRIGKEGWLPVTYTHSNGDIWVRSKTGLSRIRDRVYKGFNLSINGIYVIRETEKGNLILGTDHGLFFVELYNGEIIKCQKFTKQNGVPESPIFTLEYLENSGILFGTSRGLFKINQFNDEISDSLKFKTRLYNKADGLVGVDFVRNSNFLDKKGTVWMGTSSGLVHYLPEKDVPNLIAPLLSLESIKLSGEIPNIWELRNGNFNNILQEINPFFRPSQNDLTFEVKGITTTNPLKLEYQYFMEGLDDDWNFPTKYPSFRFNNLEPGTYNFRCRVINSDGILSDEISYSFRIDAHLYQKTWFILLIIFSSIGLISGIFYLRQLQLKRDKRVLEEKVEIRTEQLKEEKSNVEKKNKQILQSINYAKRIQQSILPDDNLMQDFFRNHFIFYQPKDVVGGDFYWFRSFGDIAVIATVDCTGHGVPGGFMSMMGSLLLDKIVQENYLDTSKILEKLNHEIIRVLKQDNEESMQDGMDLAICVVNKKTRKISFSGARNGIFVLDGNNKQYYDADLFPVGGYYSKKSKEIERNYTSTSLTVNKDSWIFMYTDGYYDQLGGERMLSLGMDMFMAHLSKAVKSSDENVAVLKEEYNNWRGQIPPIDDVLVIGFQV